MNGIDHLENVRKEFNIDELHRRGIVGENVTIAVLDTGICISHKDLENACVGYFDSVNNRKYAYDDNGHGTHIAGIIAGRGLLNNGKYTGIAPKSQIVSVKVLSSDGKGRMKDMKNGIEWIIANAKKYNIRIVNMSVGATDTKETEDSELVKVTERLWDNGIVVVAAAGNNGPEYNSISSPGISRKIITVGSYDDDKKVSISGNRVMVNYSGRGPTNSCVVKPEIVAPGFHIVSCSNGNDIYSYKSGTSMATPIVTGMCALVVGRYPQITPKELKKMIHDSAIDLHLQKNRQGWGKLNLQKYLL